MVGIHLFAWVLHGRSFCRFWIEKSKCHNSYDKNQREPSNLKK